ncbi:MAG: ABC-F family ATP-binding cassette domain-containing protein [Cytophagales bacterium]|nr:ABC-F family ATP-binding cassette domain-containing protein [Bernardetiaceae bacterium]MDW8204951.1 ABC-F family ATP-binding cassette domain-containing protein [Cytophagales bacterium]
MLSINNLSFYLGSRALYRQASLHIKPKDRIGLIGANGTGKSTLLRLIVGEYTPDEGNIEKSGDCTIGFLNQDFLSYQTDETILSVAMQAFERQNKIQQAIDLILAQMEKEYSADLVEKLGALQEEFQMLDGYSLQAKAEEILEGLGFATSDLHRPLREFSGGWRMRVMLAKMLLMKPSLLMLDEPTNHLDLPSIQWLENYLRAYEGAIVVVSHDREFLDNVCNTIVEVAQQKLHYYPGNYSFYLEEKALRAEIQNNAYENQQQAIRQAERFIERFKAQASKARQVQSRIKALERMELVEEVVDETARVNFRFTFDQQPGKIIAQLENISKSYGNHVILQHAQAVIERGDKIALIGANGRGKSTLLRIIEGREPIQGRLQIGHNVKIAMYAQHQLEVLNLENTILDELKQAGSNKTEAELRSILGCFLFSGDDVFKKIKVLSGGEKSRVALALTLISRSNFLLLDEPTNHLDMQSVNILIQALQQYEGSFIVVSHDRYFVSQIANKIWWIENYQIKEYPGTYEEFVYWQHQQQKQAAANLPQPAASTASTQTNQKTKANNVSENEREEARKQLKKLQKQLEETERRIGACEQQKKQLEEEMTLPFVYANPEALAKINAQYEAVKAEIEKETEIWEQLASELDALEAKI